MGMGMHQLEAERNLYKGKYRALLKLVSRTRNKLVQVTDHIEDEGDRKYFGSTNQADALVELFHEMEMWVWDALDKTNRMKSDPYADIRKQRARAETAEEISKELTVALTEARIQIEILQERLGIKDTGAGTLSIIDAALAKAKEKA